MYLCISCGKSINNVDKLAKKSAMAIKTSLPFDPYEYEYHLRLQFNTFCSSCIIPINCKECVKSALVIQDKCPLCMKDTNNIEPNSYQIYKKYNP